MEYEITELDDLLGSLSEENNKLLRDKMKDTAAYKAEHERTYYLQLDNYNAHYAKFGEHKKPIAPHEMAKVLDKQVLDYGKELQQKEREAQKKAGPQKEGAEKQEKGPAPQKEKYDRAELRDMFREQMDEIGRDSSRPTRQPQKEDREKQPGKEVEKDTDAKKDPESLRELFRQEMDEIGKDKNHEDKDIDKDKDEMSKNIDDVTKDDYDR